MDGWIESYGQWIIMDRKHRSLQYGMACIYEKRVKSKGMYVWWIYRRLND